MANCLVALAILHAGEGKGGKGGRLEVGERAMNQIHQGPQPNPQGEVTEAKQVVGGLDGDAQVFARVQKKIETEDQTVGSRVRCRRMLLVRQGDGVLSEKSQWQQFDPARWFITFGPGLVEGRNAKI